VLQHPAEGTLPAAGAQVAVLQRNVARGGEDQPPGELGGGCTGAAALEDQDAEPVAGGPVDLAGVRPGEADHPQPRQPLEERRGEKGALADRDDGVEPLEPGHQRILVLQAVVEHDHVERRELAEAVEGAGRILEVIQDGDAPARASGRRSGACHRSAFPGHSVWMLAALMTRSHRAKSSRSQPANSFGPRPAWTAPSLRNCSAVAGLASESWTALLSFSTIAGGVPAGASMPTPGE